MAPTELAEWVEAARDGDSGAVARIYLYLRRRLLPRLQRRLPRQLDPEDVLDETMIAVWQNLGRLRHPGHLLGYAATVATHLAAQARRELSRYEPISTCREVARPDPAARNLEAEELHLGMVAGLSEKERRLFRLLFVLGQEPETAAMELGSRTAKCRVLKHRLLLRLRRISARLGCSLS